MSQFADNIWFHTEQCCNCGMAFAMTQDFYNRARYDHNVWFYCPQGHKQHYTGESEESKLRREAERQRQIAEAAQAKATTAEAEREQIAKAHRKMRTRIANGVCPCCNRQFPNLLRHMQTQHPELKESQPLKMLRTAFGMSQGTVAKEAGVKANYVSAYEHERYIPRYAKERLDIWVAKHESQETKP